MWIGAHSDGGWLLRCEAPTDVVDSHGWRSFDLHADTLAEAAQVADIVATAIEFAADVEHLRFEGKSMIF